MNPSASSPLRAVLLALVLAGGAVLLFSIGDVVRLVLLAALLAYLLDPLAKRIESHGVHRTLATGLIFLGFSVGLTVSLVLFFPVVLQQLRSFQSGAHLEGAERLVVGLEAVMEDRLSFLGFEEVDLLESVRSYLSTHAQDVLWAVPSVFSLALQLTLIPILLFFLLRDAEAIRKGFVGLVPNRYFELVLSVLHHIDVQLGNYLRGQLLIALIIGILSTVALWLIGVEYFFLIGVLAGLANLVPYLGFFAGAGLAVVVSLATTGGFDQVVAILAAFLIIQAIENVALQPLILSRRVSMHPLLVLLSLLVGGKLFGVLGMFFAVPAAAILKVVGQEVYAHLRRFQLGRVPAG